MKRFSVLAAVLCLLPFALPVQAIVLDIATYFPNFTMGATHHQGWDLDINYAVYGAPTNHTGLFWTYTTHGNFWQNCETRALPEPDGSVCDFYFWGPDGFHGIGQTVTNRTFPAGFGGIGRYFTGSSSVNPSSVPQVVDTATFPRQVQQWFPAGNNGHCPQTPTGPCVPDGGSLIYQMFDITGQWPDGPSMRVQLNIYGFGPSGQYQFVEAFWISDAVPVYDQFGFQVGTAKGLRRFQHIDYHTETQASCQAKGFVWHGGPQNACASVDLLLRWVPNPTSTVGDRRRAIFGHGRHATA